MTGTRPDPEWLRKYPNAITQEDVELRNRFLGVLAGLAVGDALGAAHEFRTAQELAASHPAGVREIEPGRAGLRAGEPTEETQLALLVAESVLSLGRVDAGELGVRLVQWLASKPKDVGAITQASIENLRAGESPRDSGAIAWEDHERDAADNASLTMIVPVALLRLRAREQLVEDVTTACRITHYDPRCVAASVALASALGGLVRGDDDALFDAAVGARSIDDRVRVVVERGLARPPASIRVDGKDRSNVLLTLELAFSAAAHASHFEDGLAEVVARGGDTDANASVAGALLGARFGRSAIPDRWLHATQATARLRDLGDKLHKRVTGK